MQPETLDPVILPAPAETIFERCWWLYALCREYLFTDHTGEIATALAPLLENTLRSHLLEVGCGPGYYARRIAARFPHARITGVDLSEPLLSHARSQARRSGAENCTFVRGDALSLTGFPDQVDAVIASRLFLILTDRAAALNAIFMTLRPGGLCFIAEPQSRLRSMIPLQLMQMFAHALRQPAGPYEQVNCEVLTGAQFEAFLNLQPWQNVRVWQNNGYQFAVCKKAA